MPELSSSVVRSLADLLVELTARQIGMREILQQVTPNPAMVDDAIQRATARVRGLPTVQQLLAHPDATQLGVVANTLLTTRQ